MARYHCRCPACVDGNSRHEARILDGRRLRHSSARIAALKDGWLAFGAPKVPKELAFMAYLLGLPVEAGSKDVLVFEVDRNEVSGDLVLASPEPGKIADRAQVTLEEALDKLKPSLRKVVHMLKELSPDETVVEFGLKMGGETGVIIAKGTAEVNFTVRMSWKQE